MLRHILTLITSLVFVLHSFGQQPKPNVILIMTDDQGYGELSCHGNPVLKTPNIDKLYGQSIRLTDFHVTPMCTPTRGQLLTGIDAARNGAINVSSGRTLLHAGIPTMADFFKDNGYSTALFGKWHLGENYPYTPELRGFQESIWFPSSHIGSVPDYWGNDLFDDTYVHNGKREKFSGYCTDIFFENAISWMTTSTKSGRPFFTYLPLNAPHSPWNAPDENVKEMEIAFSKSGFAGMEPALKNKLIHYLAMIRNIDKNMGKLLEFLDKSGLRQNTILIFTTDNGSTFAPDYYSAGMRGKKTDLWEGGHRVPFFISWQNGKLGLPRDIDGLTQVQDVLPTLIELCGLTTTSPPVFDGTSLLPALLGTGMPHAERTLIINYSRMPAGFDYPSPSAPSIMRRKGAVVLWKRWRLIEEDQLYDLATDPMQKTNVIDKHPEIADRLKRHLAAWWEKVSPRVNEPVRLTVGSDSANPVLLTSCEWMDVLVDQQAQVLNGFHRNSYWNIEVEKGGDYEFELRRWPREFNIPLMDAPHKGRALPIAVARLYINDKMNRTNIARGDKSAVFNIKLKPGRTTLHSWFCDAANEPLCGAYYVYVRRK